MEINLLKFNKSIRENKAYLFWLAYILYMAELLFFESMYGEMESLQLFFMLARNISYILVCTKVLLDFFYNEYGKKELVLIILGTILLLIVAKMAKNKSLLIYWTFIVAAHDVDLEKIVKASLLIHFFCMFIIIASSIGNVVEDRMYYQDTVRERASLGYQYTTDSSNYFFHMLLMYIYTKKEKISWESIGVLGLCNVLLFKLTDTRSAFLLGCLVLVVTGIWKAIPGLRKGYLLYKGGAVLAMPVMSGLMMYLTFFYDEQKTWMGHLNELINGRLLLGYTAFKTYGLHLLGQPIQWIGGAQSYVESPGVYNYVDSSYIQIILNYGILIFGLVCFLFIALGKKAAKKGDIYLMLVLVIIALHSAIDPQLLWMACNPFLMCFLYLKKEFK